VDKRALRNALFLPRVRLLRLAELEIAKLGKRGGGTINVAGG
jgi:hypothetical protein